MRNVLEASLHQTYQLLDKAYNLLVGPSQGNLAILEVDQAGARQGD
jgi:hypothetical protein